MPAHSTASRFVTALGQPCHVCLLSVCEWRSICRRRFTSTWSPFSCAHHPLPLQQQTQDPDLASGSFAHFASSCSPAVQTLPTHGRTRHHRHKLHRQLVVCGLIGGRYREVRGQNTGPVPRVRYDRRNLRPRRTLFAPKETRLNGHPMCAWQTSHCSSWFGC